MKNGSHEIDGDDLFVNIVEYETTTPEKSFLGSTQAVSGSAFYAERSGTDRCELIDNMEQKEFVEKDDFLPLEW